MDWTPPEGAEAVEETKTVSSPSGWKPPEGAEPVVEKKSPDQTTSEDSTTGSEVSQDLNQREDRDYGELPKLETEARQDATGVFQEPVLSKEESEVVGKAVERQKVIAETPMPLIEERAANADLRFSDLINQRDSIVTTANEKAEILNRMDGLLNLTPEEQQFYNETRRQYDQLKEQVTLLEAETDMAAISRDEALADRYTKRSQKGSTAGAMQNVVIDGFVDMGAQALRMAGYIRTLGSGEGQEAYMKMLDEDVTEKAEDLKFGLKLLSRTPGVPGSIPTEETTPEFIAENTKEMGLKSGLITVAQSAPMMAGSYVTMFLGMAAEADKMLKEAPGSENMSIHEKMGYQAIYGTVGALLEKAGLQAVLGVGAGGKVATDVTNRVIKSIVGRGEKLTLNNVQRAALNLTKGATAEGLTEVGQESLAIGMEEVTNILKDEEVFTPNEWQDVWDRNFHAFKMGLNAGLLMTSPVAVVTSGRKMAIERSPKMLQGVTEVDYENAEAAMTPEGREDVDQYIDAQAQSGNLDPETAEGWKAGVDEFIEVNGKMKDGMTTEQKMKAFPLIQRKQALKDVIANTEESFLTDENEQIEQINQKLAAIVGNKIVEEEAKSEPKAEKVEPVEEQTQEEISDTEEVDAPVEEIVGETQEEATTSLDEMSEEELDALYAERESAIAEQEQTLAEQEYAVFQETGEASDLAIGSVAYKVANSEELSEVEQSIFDSNEERVATAIESGYEYQGEEAKTGAREAMGADILMMLPKINYESFVQADDNIDPSPAFRREYFAEDGMNMDQARDAVQGELDSAGMGESDTKVTVDDIAKAIRRAAALESEGKPYTRKQIEKSVQPKKTKENPFKSIADNIRAGKISDDIMMSGLPGFKEAFNLAVEATAQAVEAAGTISQQYKVFMDHFTNTDFWKGLTKSQQDKAGRFVRDQLGIKAEVKEDSALRKARMKVNHAQEQLDKHRMSGNTLLTIPEVDRYRRQKLQGQKEFIAASMDIGKDLPVTGVKEKIADVKSKIQEKLTAVRKDLRAALNREGTAKSRAEAIESARKGLAEVVKELPKGIKVPARFLKSAAEAKTDKQIEKIIEGLEFYVEKQIRFSKIKQIREQAKKVSKKLRQSSTYTNKEGRVTELLGLDFSKQSSATLDEVLEVMNQLATRPVAQVRSEQIDALIKKIDRVNDKVETPADPEEIQRKLDVVFDESKTFRSRQAALTRANNILNASRDIIGETEYNETLEKIEEAQKYLNEQAEQAAVEMNAESEQMLIQVDESDMNQFQKEQVKELKRAVRMSRETGDNKNYNKAVRLQDIATELAYGYAPMQKMQEYITSLESESISTDGAKQMNNRGAGKTIRESKFLSWVVPDVFKRKGIDRRDLEGAVRQLKLENWQFFDDYFGTGKSEWVYKNIIAPFFSRPIVKSYNESIRDYRDGYMKIVDGGLKAVKKTAQKKILMAMMQGNWNVSKDGSDYWGQLLRDEKFETLAAKDKKEIQKLYDELPKETIEVDGEQITRVDAEGYLNSLSGKEKKLYSWLVENNKKYSERQRTANERRGQKFVEEDSRYYFPLFRQDFDFTNDGINDFVSQVVSMAGNPNTKMKSDRGIARTSGKITPISLDMDNLVREQIFSTNRDLYLSEAIKTGLKAVGKLRNKLTDKDAFKYATALHEALKSRIKTEYENRRSVFGKLTMGFYARALISKHRVIVEPIVETVRTASAMPYGQIAKSLQFRSTSFTNEGARKLMDKTGSSFLQDIYLESLAERDRTSMRAGKRGVRKATNVIKTVAGKAQSFPERMTNNLSWLPSFMLEFKRASGKEFNVKDFNNDPDAYIEANSDAINSASGFADARTEKLKGAKTRAGQREIIRVAPDFLSPGGKGGIKAGNDVAKLVMVLQNFAFLEQYNIMRNIRESFLYGENKDRKLAAREGVGAIISGAMYVWGVGYVIAAFNGDDEEKEKLMSFDGVQESLKSNIAFLAGGRFGNSSKIAALMATGIYSMALKKKGTKESKEELKELLDWTRSRYFSQPFDFGGYKSEADFYGAMLPMVNYLYGDVESSLDNATDLYAIIDKQQRGVELTPEENETLVMMSLINDVQRSLLLVGGTQIPFQREIDKYIREEKKRLKESKTEDRPL